MKIETIADQLFFTTAYLEATCPDGSKWSATGFVYAVQTSDGPAPMLVTNKHVLAGISELVVRMPRRGPDGNPDFGKATQITINAGGNQDWWTGHPNAAVDVACFPLAIVYTQMDRMGAPPYFRSIAHAFAPTPDQMESLDSFEEVVFVGYPNGLYDTTNFTPILRRGTTATPISLDYRGLPSFLIDAAVYPGSSGSPVILFSQGMYAPRSGGIALGNRLLLLGVLAAVHQRAVVGELVELTTSSIPVVSQPIGLGIVYKTSAIAECIDLDLARRGVARVPMNDSAAQ